MLKPSVTQDLLKLSAVQLYLGWYLESPLLEHLVLHEKTLNFQISIESLKQSEFVHLVESVALFW